MKMSDDEFVEFMAKGQLQTRLGDVVELPDSIYKKGRELNAERTMILTLKARRLRNEMKYVRFEEVTK